MQVQCGSCSQLVETPADWAGGDFVCPRCGVTVRVAAPLPPAPTPAAAGRRCPYCSEAIQDDAAKCRHCGEWLDPAKRAALEAARKLLPKFQKGMKGLGWGVVIIALLNLFSVAAVAEKGGGAVQTIVVIFIVAVIGALGVLLLTKHVWANYGVIAVFALLGVLLLINMGSGDARGVVGILIAIVAIVNGVGNIRNFNDLRAAGLDPWEKAEKKS